MVDETRHQRRYGRLSESPGSDDGDVSLASSFNPSSSDQRPRHSRKQNIRVQLREEADYNPEPYSSRSARDRSRYGLSPDGSYEHKSSRSSNSESDEDDDEPSSDASSDSNIRLPKRAPRSSGRTRGRKVNYSNAFKDLSDSDEEQTYRSQNGRSVDNPNRGSSASFTFRNQPSLLQKPRGPLIRTCAKAPERLIAPRSVAMSDAESDGLQHDNSSNGSSVESRPVRATAYATATEEVETDVIEEVLTQAMRRVGATGNNTTLYNCRLERDPNEGFDPEKEKGEIQYLIKWRQWSHIHSTWETEASLTSPDRACPVDGMKRLYAFQQKMREREARESVASRDELETMLYEAERDELILAEKMEVERIVAHSRDQRNEIDYLCKWRRLDYRACSWESGQVVNLIFPAAVEDYKRRCSATTLPNPQNIALKQRPRFVRMLEQPRYLGSGNPDLQLRDYQLKGLNWIAHAWTRGNSVILADEMGLGKTVQAVSFLSYLFHEHSIYGPFLIVVPLSTISNWQSELELWAPSLNLIVYTGDVTSRMLIRENEWNKNGVRKSLKFNVCMTSYEILLKDRSFLGQVSWAALVVDEAHRLKNDDSQLYKALFAFNTNTRLLITGTPLQNSLRELWSLLHFLMPNSFESWEDFEEDYSLHSHASSADGYEAITRLHRTLEPYLLRRVKKDVEQSLPAKVERILKVEMSKRQATLYRLILTRNYEGLLKVTRGHKTSFCNIVMELKKCCNHSNLIDPLNSNEPYRTNSEVLRDLIKGSGKLMLLDKLLQKLRPQGHRVLIFSQMVRMLDIIEQYLQLRGWGFQRLDGSIKGELRKQALDHFNAEGSTDFCFLLSTRAGGLGINLATADTVVIFDSDWNPQNDLQAQARCHRIGQTKQVSVYRLVVKDSVEEKIIESATRKMLLDHLVIQRMETGGNRKSDTKGQVLTEILRHGAENIFKQNEEEMGEAEVDIDDILNNAETRNAEAEEDPYNPTNVLLSTFNVVTLDKLEQDDVKPVQVDSSGKSVKSWSEIIPEDLRESVKQAQNQEALLDLELGPRRRKPVKSYQAGEGKFESSESDDSGIDKKPQLSDKEIRALVKAIKRFAHPLERIEAIAADAELPNFTNEEVKEIVAAIVNGCKSAVESGPDDQEEKSKTKGPVYYYGKVAISAKPLLANIEQLDVLHEALSGLPSKEDRLKYELPFAPKHTNWPNQWNAIDDAHLLVGVYEHGYDNWEVIKLDADIGLGSKLLPVASNERPQASHVRARVDYLLKALKKHHDKTGFDKPRRHHKVPAKKYHGRHNYHKASDESSRQGIKPKSDEFVESEGDSSSDSDSVKPSTRPALTIPPLKIKTSQKRHLKVENGEGSPVTKKARVTEEKAKYEPVHYTANANSTSFTQQDEDDFRNMQGPIFQKCKVGFRALKSLLKQMEEMETRGVTDQDTYDDVIFRVGEHIRGLVKPIMDREEKRVWRRYYWMFVQFFSKMDEHALESAYTQERKKRASEDKDSLRRREGDNDRDHHERSHHHHRRHHKRHRDGEVEPRDRSTRDTLPNGDRASSSHWDDKKNYSHHRHGDRTDYRYHASSTGFTNSNDRSSKYRPGRADWSSRNDNDDRFNNAFNRPTTTYPDAFNNPELYNNRGGHDDRNFAMTESSIPPPFSSSSSVKPPTSSLYSWQGYKAPTQSLAMSGSSIIPPPLNSAPSTSNARDPRLWNRQ